jgi:Zn-dependent oligopeptidase
MQTNNAFFKLSNLLGFKNFSEYQLTLLCAKNPENVENFLNKLAEKMRILQKKEMDILLKYKKEEVNKEPCIYICIYIKL